MFSHSPSAQTLANAALCDKLTSRHPTPWLLSASGAPAALTRGNPEERRLSIMRDYELLCIVHSDLDENALGEVVKRINGWITDNGGTVVKTDIWGKRQLAYPIRKQKQGQYVLFQVNMAPSTGAILERNLRFQEPVLRFLLSVK
jgi:small subunit ribosomal protein S6